MSHITISALAVEKIVGNPKFRQLTENDPERAWPLLYYYRRSFSTLEDGTTIENGDGFMLTYVNPEELRDTGDIVYKRITAGGGTVIIVGGTKSVISGSFSIGWSNAKFTFERDTSS